MSRPCVSCAADLRWATYFKITPAADENDESCPHVLCPSCFGKNLRCQFWPSHVKIMIGVAENHCSLSNRDHSTLLWFAIILSKTHSVEIAEPIMAIINALNSVRDRWNGIDKWSVRFVGKVELIPTYIFYRKFGKCDRFFSVVALYFLSQR